MLIKNPKIREWYARATLFLGTYALLFILIGLFAGAFLIAILW
jgi:hypothetical protein